MPSLPAAPQVTARRRAACLAELAHGTERFLEPRRAQCPWCGSPRLRTRFSVPDLLQGRPGTFGVDVCRDCAHVFQNPRLTPEGLAFHFRDPQPRTGDPRASRRRMRATARVMLAYGEPEGWLDVGTGDADFPEAARAFFPYTAFDGLDPTPRVLRARAADRLEEAYVGHLTTPGITDGLHARYDVVSLLHQLNRTRTPAPTSARRSAWSAPAGTSWSNSRTRPAPSRRSWADGGPPTPSPATSTSSRRPTSGRSWSPRAARSSGRTASTRPTT
ncbi:hypothetical protein SGLAM104S_07263 [Streptomyces glaucescens]